MDEFFGKRFFTTLAQILSKLVTLDEGQGTMPTNILLGTNKQQHKVHLMITVKMILTDAEGHMWRLKVTKLEYMVISRKPTDIIAGWYQGTTSDI